MIQINGNLVITKYYDIEAFLTEIELEIHEDKPYLLLYFSSENTPLPHDTMVITNLHFDQLR